MVRASNASAAISWDHAATYQVFLRKALCVLIPVLPRWLQAARPHDSQNRGFRADGASNIIQSSNIVQRVNASPTTDPDEWIETAARSHPQRAFLKTAAGREISYGSLREQSARFASALRQRGVRAGDRVAAQVEKSPEAVLLYVACLRLGAVFVPINTANTPHELDYFLRDSQPHIAIVRPPDLPMLDPAGATRRCRARRDARRGGRWLAARPRAANRTASPDAAAHAGASCAGRHRLYLRYDGPLERGGAHARESRIERGGARRGVALHRQRYLAAHAAAVPRHGLFAAINTVLASASSLLLLPKFDAAAVLRHLPQVSVYMGVPTHYTRLLQQEALNRRKHRARPLVRFGIGAAAHRDASGVFSAHRPHDSRALRHDRDLDEYLESVRGPASAGLGGAAAAGNRDPRGVNPIPAPPPGMRSARSRSRARTCSPATGGIPRRRAVNSRPTVGSRRAISAASMRRATCTSSAAPRIW